MKGPMHIRIKRLYRPISSLLDNLHIIFFFLSISNKKELLIVQTSTLGTLQLSNDSPYVSGANYLQILSKDHSVNAYADNVHKHVMWNSVTLSYHIIERDISDVIHCQKLQTT